MTWAWIELSGSQDENSMCMINPEAHRWTDFGANPVDKKESDRQLSGRFQVDSVMLSPKFQHGFNQAYFFFLAAFLAGAFFAAAFLAGAFFAAFFLAI